MRSPGSQPYSQCGGDVDGSGGERGRFTVTNYDDRVSCTYCGGDIEDNFSTCGLAAALFLFPLGQLLPSWLPPLLQCGPLSLVEDLHYCALIGPELP